MADIKRFNCGECDYPGGTFGEMNEDLEGEFVLHRDYEAVLEQIQILWAQKVVERDAQIARLRAELEKAAAAALANMSLACQKEREADALRAKISEYESNDSENG